MSLAAPRYGDGLKKTTQVNFYGYDASPGAGDGAIRRMENMTSDWFPLLASRPKRHLLRTLETPNGIAAAEKLCWVDGQKLYYNGAQVGGDTLLSDGEKLFAGIGDLVVIWPDKLWFDTVSGQTGSIEYKVSDQRVAFISRESEYSTEMNAVRIPGQYTGFKVGDAVEVSGCTELTGNNTSAVIRDIEYEEEPLLESYNTYLIFTDNTFAAEGAENSVTVAREAPELNFLFEHNNRLWGCRNDTVYVSALGDATNWNVFDGTASDSYAVDTGSPGKFTGACSYGGYPRFFKQDAIYTFYGTFPQEYQFQKYVALGVMPGSGKSLAVAGGVLFYLSRMGICAYTGGMPSLAAAAFGLERYHAAVGGTDGLKYYVSMKDSDANVHLFVYDAQKGIWMREDDLEVVGFAFTDERLIALCEDGKMIAIGRDTGTEGTEENVVEWMAEFADFIDQSPDDKQINQLKIRMEMDAGSSVTVQMQFDDGTAWVTLGTKMAEALQSYELPIVPRRADHYKIRLFGRGSVRIKSVARKIDTKLK